MCGGKWVREMGYFKVRAREQFVALNEKEDKKKINKRLRKVQSQASIVSAAWFKKKINNEIDKCICAGGPWVLISGASIAHLFLCCTGLIL